MRILVTNGEYTGRTGCYDRLALADGLPDRPDVQTGIAPGFVNHLVGDLGHSAAALLLQQADSVADGIHQLDKVAAERRIVVVDETAVEI